jgi:nitroreductase
MMAGANAMLNAIKNRRTVFEFSDRKVSDESLKLILEAARWAPSSHNSQPWSFIVIQNPKKIDALMAHCFYGVFHTNPNVLIAIVLEPIYEQQQGLLHGDALNYAQTHKFMNISLPTLTMCLLADALGIGSCILSVVVEEVSQILEMPQGKIIPLLVGLGYEKKGAFHPSEDRKLLESMVYRERYGAKYG